MLLANEVNDVSRKVLEGEGEEFLVGRHGPCGKTWGFRFVQDGYCTNHWLITIHPPDMVVLRPYSFALWQGLWQISQCYSVRAPLAQVIVQQPLQLVVELHRLDGELPHVVLAPLHAPLPAAVNETPVELAEGGKECLADLERYLCVVREEFVAAHGMNISFRSHQLLEVGVHKEAVLCKKTYREL